MATARWWQLGNPPKCSKASRGRVWGAQFWILEVPGDGRSTGGVTLVPLSLRFPSLPAGKKKIK